MTKGRDDDDGDDGIDDHGNESDGNTFALLPGHPKSASKRARVRNIRAVAHRRSPFTGVVPFWVVEEPFSVRRCGL